MEIDRIAPGLDRIIDSSAPLDRVVHGIHFGEGPVWDKRTRQLFFVDILGNTIYKWKPGVGREVVMHPSGYADGMTLDREGRLIVAGWSSRNVWRLETDGSQTMLATHFEGKKINAPNDIVMKSDGAIYFTDPAGGMMIPGMIAEDCQQYLDFNGVFRISPDGKALTKVVHEGETPNGLAFSPDEKILYVNDTRHAHIRAFEVKSDGSLGPGRVIYNLVGKEEGVADGMKVDTEGNIYCTGPGGIHILDSKGTLLGRLLISEHCTNFCWGDDDWRSIYITSHESVFRTRIKIPGIATW